MPLTPEERRQRFNTCYPTRYKARAKARHDARMAAMTHEELTAYRAANAAAQQRRRAKDPDAIRAQVLALRLKDPAKMRGYVKKHRLKLVADNPNYYSERYHANKESHDAASKAWRAKNPERVNAASRRYRQRHPDIINALSDRHRALQAGAAVRDLSTPQRNLVIAVAQGVCPYCTVYKPACLQCLSGTHKLTIDHITPLSKGGLHTLHNVIACCHSCNSKKKTNLAPCYVQPLLL